MKKTRMIIRFFVKALLVVLIVACKPNNKSFRLATYTYSTNDRVDNLQPLAEDLEMILGRPVDIVSYPDVASFIEGIKADEVDLGLINTLGYLLLSLDNNNMQPIATLKVKNGVADNYKTVLLTRNDNVKDLSYLKNETDKLRMLFVSEGSTSGNLVPRLFLSSIGINFPETQFKEVKYGGNHSSTFAKLIAGESDLCAFGSNEYFTQIQKDSSLLDSTRLLWISGEIPLGPVLVNNRLAEAEQKKIRDLLLDLHENNPDALHSLKAGWSEAKQAERFYAITDDYYDAFRMVNGNQTALSEILNLFSN